MESSVSGNNYLPIKELTLRMTKNFWIIKCLIAALLIVFTTSCNKVNEPVFGGTVNDIDGNVYHTVTIGSQTWLIENLKTTHFNDSTSIPLVIDSLAWTKLQTPGFCWYENDSITNNKTYGILYNWYVVNSNKIAPKGWHVPSDDEWTILENNVSQFYNTSGSLAKILASVSYWRKSTSSGAIGNNTTKNNTSGFSAVPGGYKLINKYYFSKIDSLGVWWSSTEQTDSINKAWCMSLRNDLSTVERSSYLKQSGFSIRCIKN